MLLHQLLFICRMFQQMDVSGDQKIDYKEFVAMLQLMDRRLKSLPATAQVASQQVRQSYPMDVHHTRLAVPKGKKACIFVQS